MTTPIPVTSTARRLARLEPSIIEAASRVARSGRVLLGAETEAFELEFSDYVGKQACVAVASGTEALRLGLAALGIGPGDEVIVPAFTAVPTAAAVCATGATPVLVDVDEETAALDPDAVDRGRTQATRAVIAVHLYGRPAPLPDCDLPVISDAAQAHGALGQSTRNDAASVLTAYSFYPTKNLGGFGDGGAVVTDDPDLAARVRLLRTHGLTDRYVHDAISTNARMSEFEAAVLRAGLAMLDADNTKRRTIARRLRGAAPHLTWQADHPDHVYHLLVARVAHRDAWRRSLPFDTGVHYPVALTQQPAYRRFAREACPRAEAWAAECVSLPCFPELEVHEIDEVAAALARTDSWCPS